MSNKIYWYARVISRDQNLDRQLEVLRASGIDDRDIITNKQSGTDFNREGYITLKNSLLREGDTLVIKKIRPFRTAIWSKLRMSGMLFLNLVLILLLCYLLKIKAYPYLI